MQPQLPFIDKFQSMVANIEQIYQLEDGSKNYMYPSAYSAASVTKDTLNYGEMLQASDRHKFVQAMQSEMDSLKDKLHAVL
jgi:hypothetical protein